MENDEAFNYENRGVGREEETVEHFITGQLSDSDSHVD